VTFKLVSVLCGGPGPELPVHILDYYSYRDSNPAFFTTIDNRDNHLSPCQAYQQALEESSDSEDVLIYVHDDVTIHDPNWLKMVLLLFGRIFGPGHEYVPRDIVAVGLGGATALGHPNLYKRPFNIWNMARGGYMSNQTDAEVHGARETGFKQVAVLDAFFMAIRRDFLVQVGGWPVGHLTHHCLDLWLACEAARRGKETWMVGASCTHHGGRSSTSPAYQKAAWLQGGTREEDHIRPHRWIWDEYRDVLPLEVKCPGQ